MPIEITIPRLGWNMEEGRFVAWLKKDGDVVRPGEPIFSLESEKSVEEVESLDAGMLRIPPDGPNEGDVLKVGTVIGFIVDSGEALAPATTILPPTPPTSAKKSRGEPFAATSPTPSPQPAAPRRGKDNKTISTPRARRIAAELGINWHELQGTGCNGRIRERDVRAAASNTADRVLPVSPLRQTIARRMLQSVRETAPVTLTTTVDATNLVSLRQQFRALAAAGGEAIPTYADIIVKLTATALQRHQMLNARWEGDRIVVSKNIHIGIAVDTDVGLLVPVLRDVPSLGLRQLAARSRDLVERARARRLLREEMEGGTFTVSNLGAFGVEAFTPIINPPECAVLGIGAIRREPAVIGEQIVARDRLT